MNRNSEMKFSMFTRAGKLVIKTTIEGWDKARRLAAQWNKDCATDMRIEAILDERGYCGGVN